MNPVQQTLLTIFVAFLVTAIPASPADAAPVGTAFSYQGQIGDGGRPANGRYDLRFGLYTAPTSGTPVAGMITNANVSVSEGLFTTSVDFGQNVFDGTEYWLELGVRPGADTGAFTPMTPRQLLAPTPYALHAKTAGGVADDVAVRSINGLRNDFNIVGGEGVMVDTTRGSIVIAAVANCHTYSNCYWNLLGNGNLTPGVNFLGTVAGELAPLEFRVNNNRSLLHTFTGANTAPNIAGGYRGNVVSGTGGTISGGGQSTGINRVSANYGTVGGGVSNVVQAAGTLGTIGGGASNQVVGVLGAIAGGALNVVSNNSFIGGGNLNRSISDDGVIGGGEANLLTSYPGGGGFVIATTHSTIGGGASNAITGGVVGTIGGGQENRVTGTGSRQVHYATIAGGQGNAVLSDTFSSHYSTIGGGFSNRVSTAGRATIGGGDGNTILLEGHGATIGGGVGNRLDGPRGTISGGESNFVSTAGSPDYVTIGGGRENGILTDSHYATIAGGRRHRIQGNSSHASIGGGLTNSIETANFGTISGGGTNSVTGDFGTVPGGRQNRAQGNDSFAAGLRAVAQHNGSFVWADDTDADFASTSTKQFAVRADNGVMIQAGTRALDLRGGGAVRVEGAGIGSSGPAFIHRATAANINAHTTTINHPHCNGDPNAILIVTPNWNPGGVGGTYNNHAIGVYYTGAVWAIFNQDLVNMPLNAAFNVLVIKP
jgi:hypothetical protein